VFVITPVEGVEASLVHSPSVAFDLEWTLTGAEVGLSLLIVTSAISCDYLTGFLDGVFPIFLDCRAQFPGNPSQGLRPEVPFDSRSFEELREGACAPE